MRHLGWVMFAATCVLILLQGLLLGATGLPMLSSEVQLLGGFPLVSIGAVIGAAVGALIVSRYPRNTVGWLFCIGQLGNAINLAGGAYLLLTVQGPSDVSTATRIAIQITGLFDATWTAAILAVIFMISPDGRLLSRRWRFAVSIPVIAWLLRVVVSVDFTIAPLEQDLSNELSVPFIVADIVSGVLLLVSLGLGAAALGIRLRRSTGERRRQLRWITVSATVLAVAFVLVPVSNLIAAREESLLVIVLYLSYIGVTVSVGIAILRHRLYDVDVILSRAIVLGVLAVFVAVGYIVVVVAIGEALAAVGTAASGLYWPSLVATALVAVGFQPLRRHVLRLADRLVYGEQAAPYEALANLSRRLADSPAPEELPLRVADAAGRAVGAAWTRVQLGTPGEIQSPGAVATWPDPMPAPTEQQPISTLPVVDRGERVGSLTVAMPRGRELRQAERGLLSDFAEQAGLAFRNAMLQAELAARVDEVQARSRELQASRRRLVGVQDVERERLAAAIQRRVLPHLAPVIADLSSWVTGRPPASGDVAPLIAHTENALEELRAVCRGVFPALLERRGLVPALSAQLDVTHRQATLTADATADTRFDRAAEAAGYLFCIEVAPTDRPCLIDLRVPGDRLLATVTGDGEWGSDAADPEASWQHARDRVAASGGHVLVQRGSDGSTQVQAVIPLRNDPPHDRPVRDLPVRDQPVRDQPVRDAEIATQTSSSRSGPNMALET